MKEKQPHISVIIPVYNGEDSIIQCLDSLHNQNYTDFEAIIIDDGSTDRTAERVRQYAIKDKRLNYTYQQNAGVAMARNQGIALAKGKYISFLDCDDYYEFTFLYKMLSTIENTNTDICYCGYNLVTPSGIKRRKTLFKNGDILEDYILGKVSVQTTGWMIRREFLHRLNLLFPEGVSWGEDFEFFCKALAQTSSVSHVKAYLTNYRSGFNKDQLSTFSMDKFGKDYECIKRIQLNKTVNRNPSIDRALIDYRLSAILTYHFLNACKLGIENKELQINFKTYKDLFVKFTWNNGLRSAKLNVNKLRLFVKYKLSK